jgi:LysR family transcriptional regulator, low CO2-responsive transcriptional regulator
MKEKLNALNLRDITLRQFAVIAAIAKTGKITNAANALGVTPPAVTAQLKLLESLVGVALFDRASDGMRPTDAGKYLLSIQKKIAATIDECAEGLMEMRGLKRGHLVFGAVTNASAFAPQIISAFSRLHPGIVVELVVGNSRHIQTELDELRLDIAIMGRPADMSAVACEIIADHPHVIVAAPDHPLAKKRRLALSDLADQAILMREVGSGTRTLMERTFHSAQIEQLITKDIGNAEAIKHAVMAGLGLAFMSAHSVADELTTGKLKVLPIQSFPVLRKWYVVHTTIKTLMPSSRAMWDFVLTRANTFIPRFDTTAHFKSSDPSRAPADSEINHMS